MKKILYISIFAVLTYGCATSADYYRFDVEAQSLTHGQPGKYYCRLNYSNQDEWKIDGQFYTQLTEELLTKKGITILSKNDKKQADCIINIRHDTSFGKEQHIGYTYGQTGIASASSSTNTLGQTTTTYTPTFGVTSSYTYDVPKSYILFSMSAIDAQTKKEIWNINVFRSGHIEEDFTGIFPLFTCIISHYIFKNYKDKLLFTEKELQMALQGHCNLLEWPKN